MSVLYVQLLSPNHRTCFNLMYTKHIIDSRNYVEKGWKLTSIFCQTPKFKFQFVIWKMAPNYFDKLCKAFGSSTIFCTTNFPKICLLHTVFLYKSRNIKEQLLVNIIAIAPEPLTFFCPNSHQTCIFGQHLSTRIVLKILTINPILVKEPSENQFLIIY